MSVVLTPYALRLCPVCAGTGVVQGKPSMPCECRYETELTDLGNIKGQKQGWITRCAMNELVLALLPSE